MSCREKQERIKQMFAHTSSAEQVYQTVIDLGRKQPHLALEDKVEGNLVQGC